MSRHPHRTRCTVGLIGVLGLMLGPWPWGQVAAEGPADRATQDLTTTVTVDVTAADPLGGLPADLKAADFTLLAEGHPRDFRLERGSSPRHLIVVLDFSTTSIAERQRALPPLREFLLARLAQGDRVSLGALGVEANLRWPLLFGRDAAELARVVDLWLGFREAARPSASLHPKSWADDYQQLTAALAQMADEGRATAVFYLGAALYAAVDQAAGMAARVERNDTDVNAVGTVQYLVVMPRAGPLTQRAREAGEQLLATAAADAVVFYPILPTEALVAGEPWLASETGGRPLALERLAGDLEHLAAGWAQGYRLIFPAALDPKLQRLEIKTRHDNAASLRHPKVFRSRPPAEQLAAQARTALVLGREPAAGWQSRVSTTGAETATPPGLGAPPELKATLELDIAADALGPTRPTGLTLAVALEMGGKWMVREQRIPVRPGSAGALQLRIPLRLPAETRRLGLALRLEREAAAGPTLSPGGRGLSPASGEIQAWSQSLVPQPLP